MSRTTQVVLNLPLVPFMAICATDGCPTLTPAGRSFRVLRWTFRRGDDTVCSELGLDGDDSAYELRLNPPWNPAAETTERFDDAMSAFQRHAAIERMLVQDGWTLDAFESTEVARTV
jgi:hypothetical protein